MNEYNQASNSNEQDSANTNDGMLPIEYSPLESELYQPRPPSNLQGLLRYAVEIGTQSSGGRGTTSESDSVRPLSDSDTTFLMNALNSMMVNVPEELSRIIKVLIDNPNDENVSIEALDNLEEYMYSIDYANDFLKIGGTPVLKYCLESKFSEVRWRTADIIANIVQNNPTAQLSILNSGIDRTLLDMIENDLCEAVRVKCLYAISCWTRNNEQCTNWFVQQDGLSMLIRCLQSNVKKLIIKSCFLISCLCSEVDSTKIKQSLFSMGLVEQICVLLCVDDEMMSDCNEHLLTVLSYLIVDFPDAVEQCKQPGLKLKEKLMIFKESLSKDECGNQLINVKQLLKDLFQCDADELSKDVDAQDR